MNPNEPQESDAPSGQVALATLLCAVSVALFAVPLALLRAGPDWIEIPIVLTAIFSAIIVLAEGFQIAGRARRLATGASSPR